MRQVKEFVSSFIDDMFKKAPDQSPQNLQENIMAELRKQKAIDRVEVLKYISIEVKKELQEEIEEKKNEIEQLEYVVTRF